MFYPIERITIEPGNSVVCDACNDDYTHSDAVGGLLFQSKAICPNCSPKWEAGAKEYGETHLIKARCPADKSFADWVRDCLR